MSAVRIPVAFILTSILARLVGPSGVGQWALVMACTGLLNSFLFNWTQAPNIRFGTEEWIVSKTLRETWAARWPLLFGCTAFCLLLFVFQPFNLLERYFSLPSSWWFFLFFFTLGRVLLTEVQNIYRVVGKLAQFSTIAILIDLLTILFLAYLFLDQPQNKGQVAMLGMGGILTIVSLIVWIKEFNFSKSKGGLIAKEKSLKIVRYGLPLIPGLGLAYLSSWAPVLILQYFGSTADVGFYNISFQVMSALLGLASPISVLFLPKIIEKKINDEKAEADYISSTCPTVASLWLIVIIPLLVFVPFFFSLFFGSEFAPSMPMLLLLCGAIPGAAFTALYATLFDIQGRLGKSSLFTAYMLIVSVVVTLCLVKNFAGVGLAIGTLISYFVVQALYIFDQHRFLSVSKSKILILYIFSSAFGILQFWVGSDLGSRLGIAVLALFCLIIIIRKFNLVEERVLRVFFTGKTARYYPIIYTLLIKNLGPL